MTLLRPFRALRYDTEAVDLARVIVPPYDVISPDDRVAFYERDPHNAIRLELTKEVEQEAATDYLQIRDTLDAWRRSGVLKRDAQAAFYALRQSFEAPDGTPTVREGFFALLHLEDYARGIVRPHERTLAGPKADRLKVLRAARANLSSVFLLYEDRADELARALAADYDAECVASARDETGTLHTLARVADPERIAAVSALFADLPVVMADGHHRYETGLTYRDEQRATAAASQDSSPSEWLLAYFANAYAPGSLLLPIHRLIRKGGAPTPAIWEARLSGWQQTTVPVPSVEEIPVLLEEHLAPFSDRPAFAADDASGVLRIFSRPAAGGDELPVRAVHREVIDGVFGLDEQAVFDGAIEYPKSALRTAQDVRAGRGSVALYLNALSPDDVFRVTGAGEVLPQKSTFFFPKLPTGLVFRLLESEEGAAP